LPEGPEPERAAPATADDDRFPPMPTVKIPPVLRSRTDGASEVPVEGETVGEVLEALADAHSETRAQLFGDGGELNRYVNVYLNDEDVRLLDGLDTTVSASDTVVILPAMAGGR
jgi:sulfur-carrier protein